MLRRQRRGTAGSIVRYIPGSGVQLICARALAATYKDSSGVRQTAGINVLRDGHFIAGVRTTLVEGQRTNNFINSSAPVTQTTPSLSVGTYTIWMEGTGTATVSAGTATITGAGAASNGVPVTFQVTVAGTVTYTIAGGPTLVQCEDGAFPSSYILTAGAAVTRPADLAYIPFGSPQPMTIYADVLTQETFVNANSGGIYEISTIAPRLWGYVGGSNVLTTLFHNGTTQLTGTTGAIGVVAVGDEVELRHVLNPDGSTSLTYSWKGGAESAAASTAANALPAAFGEARLYLGQGNNIQGFMAFKSLKVRSGSRSLAEMRAA